MEMTKTIKLHYFTLNRLKDLKPEYADKYPGKEITHDIVVSMLIEEHTGLEKKLRDEFVTRSNYDELYTKYATDELKIEEMTDEHKATLKELKDNKKDLLNELEEQRGLYDTLQSTLSVKENELTQLNEKNKELRQSLITVEQNLLSTQDENLNFSKKHNQLVYYMDHKCIEKTSLDALYHISCFLIKNKRSMYTPEQLCDAILCISADEIKNALIWTNQKIFPVRKVVSNNQEVYCYDRQYLKW